MKIKPLYRYERLDGGITVSQNEPNIPYTFMYRIIADDGKLVTRNGIDLYPVVDTDNSEDWYEVHVPEEESK